MLNETQEPLTSEFARKRLFVKKLSQIGDLVLHVYNLNLCSDEHFLSHFLWQDYVWTMNTTNHLTLVSLRQNEIFVTLVHSLELCLFVGVLFCIGILQSYRSLQEGNVLLEGENMINCAHKIRCHNGCNMQRRKCLIMLIFTYFK